MLVKLERELQAVKDQRSESVTAVAIHGNMDFRKTDGFIQFMKMALGNIPAAYGKQHNEWDGRIRAVICMAETLEDRNVRFMGTTKEEFRHYCIKTSSVMDREHKCTLYTPEMWKGTEDLEHFLEKAMEQGCKLGFVYEKQENPKTGLMHDLMDQLSRLKLEKSGRNLDVSYFLYRSGYHEHIHDALNLLIQTAVYIINCSSTKECAAHGFDIVKVDNMLDNIRSIMKNVEHLV